MKCSRCGSDGPFFKDRNTKNGFSSWCKVCKNEANSTYQRSPKAKQNHLDRERAKYAEKAAFWKALKLYEGCADCGIATLPDILEFDHIFAKKEFQMVDAVRQGYARAIPEYLKCEVVCKNCHAIRTYERGGSGAHSKTVDGVPVALFHWHIRKAINQLNLTTEQEAIANRVIRAEMLKVMSNIPAEEKYTSELITKEELDLFLEKFLDSPNSPFQLSLLAE